MEEEARQILRAALIQTTALPQDLVVRIRGRFAGVGDVQPSIAEQQPVRLPPSFEERAKSAPRSPPSH